VTHRTRAARAGSFEAAERRARWRGRPAHRAAGRPAAVDPVARQDRVRGPGRPRRPHAALLPRERPRRRVRLLELLDIGDWIGVEGALFRTRTGEVTVRVASFELLAKSVRPLPFGKEEVDEATGERRVHGGFADVEQRYRQRYADLAVQPDVRAVFVARSRIVSALRRFLDERGYIEVETPVLQPLYGGASARPFTTHHNALDMRCTCASPTSST
jgi:aspartyl/asparaginyl-tRNA synthetase